jgi:hypothetical protein
MAFVDSTATGAGDGTSWADAYTSIQTAIDTEPADSTLEIAAATYDEPLIIKKNVTLLSTTDSTRSGVVNVVDTVGGSHTLRAQTPYNLNIIGDFSIKASAGASFSALRLESTGTVTQSGGVLDIQSTGVGFSCGGGAFTGAANFERVFIHDCGGRAVDYAAGTGSMSFDFLEMDNNANAFRNAFRVGASSSGIEINQLLATRHISDYVINIVAMGGVFHIQNAIVVAYQRTSNNVINNSAGAGSLVIDHSLILPNPRTAAGDSVNSYTDGGNNYGLTGNQTTPSIFKTARRPGSISLMVDDYSNIDHFEALCDYAETKGFKFCITTESRPDVGGAGTSGSKAAFSEANKVILRDLFARGHNITAHGTTAITTTLTDAIEIQYTAGAASLTISGNQLTTTGADGFTTDLTTHIRTLDLVTFINSQPNYVAAVVTGSSPQTSPTTLADVAGQDISSNYTCLFDRAKLLKYEYEECKADLEEYIPGITIRDYVYSTAAFDDYSAGQLSQYGYLQGRAASDFTTVEPWFYPDGTATGDGIRPFQTYGLKTEGYLNTGDVKRRVSALSEFVKWTGTHINLYDHGADTTSLAEWQVIIDALKECGANVITYEQQGDWLYANNVGQNDSSGTGNITLTYDMAASDAAYTASCDSFSEARQAGVDWWSPDPEPEGMDGRLIGNPPDMGVYAYLVPA